MTHTPNTVPNTAPAPPCRSPAVTWTARARLPTSTAWPAGLAWLGPAIAALLLMAGVLATPARAQTGLAQVAQVPNGPQVPQLARVAVPPYSARVLDTTGTLDSAQSAGLTDQILALEKDTRAAVVVFMLPTTGNDTIEEYATRVFETWKLGDTDRDDGILILVALDDRRMRIEVGQGLEGTVPDVLAGRIIEQQMKPRFRGNDYAGGVSAAIGSIGALIRGDAQVTNDLYGDVTSDSPVDAIRSEGLTPLGWAFLGTMFWGFGVGVVRARHHWKWPVTAGIVAAAPLVAGLLLTQTNAVPALLFPSPLIFALGYGCGRSRAVRIVAASVAGVIGGLVGLGYAVGADRFWWGFLYMMVGGMACLLLGVVVIGVRMVYKRNKLELAARGAAVLAIVGYVAHGNPPGTTWSSWIPVAVATGLSMLFTFFPNDGKGGGSSGGSRGSSGSSSRSSSSSSRSSSSSSSRSSSGGSSSGGGASGSW